jgi:putative nucleotidyltransferase with HDIG domain
MSTNLQDIVSSTNELEALPTTTVKLLELLEDPLVAADRVLQVINKDPSLTANLLKLCNSAYYGMRRQVGSVKEALVMLGNKTVITLAFATSMGDVLRGQLSAYRLAKDELWHHALATALAASKIAFATGSQDVSERAFTAGLVHDIGKLILNKVLVNQMNQLPQYSEAKELINAERDILGFDHSEAGAALAEAWNFPSMLVSAIYYHHRPEAAQGDVQLLQSVVAGDLIAAAVGMGGGSPPPSEEQLLEQLAGMELPTEVVLQLTSQLSKDVEELLSMLVQPV